MAQKGPNVQQNVPIAGTLSGTNGPKRPKCTAERPYSRDIFRDKWPKKAQMYSSPDVQQNVPIAGTSFGTNELQEPVHSSFLADNAGTALLGQFSYLKYCFRNIFLYIEYNIRVSHRYNTQTTHRLHRLHISLLSSWARRS